MCGWKSVGCVTGGVAGFMCVPHAVFEESDVTYYFMANFAKEQDEWMRLVNMAG